MGSILLFGVWAFSGMDGRRVHRRCGELFLSKSFVLFCLRWFYGIVPCRLGFVCASCEPSCFAEGRSACGYDVAQRMRACDILLEFRVAVFRLGGLCRFFGCRYCGCAWHGIVPDAVVRILRLPQSVEDRAVLFGRHCGERCCSLVHQGDVVLVHMGLRGAFASDSCVVAVAGVCAPRCV